MSPLCQLKWITDRRYYPTQEVYLLAVVEAMRPEYQAIVDAGLLVQSDDAFLTDVCSDPSLSGAERRKTAEIYVDGSAARLRRELRRCSRELKRPDSQGWAVEPSGKYAERQLGSA